MDGAGPKPMPGSGRRVGHGKHLNMSVADQASVKKICQVELNAKSVRRSSNVVVLT